MVRERKRKFQQRKGNGRVMFWWGVREKSGGATAARRGQHFGDR